MLRIGDLLPGVLTSYVCQQYLAVCGMPVPGISCKAGRQSLSHFPNGLIQTTSDSKPQREVGVPAMDCASDFELLRLGVK